MQSDKYSVDLTLPQRTRIAHTIIVYRQLLRKLEMPGSREEVKRYIGTLRTAGKALPKFRLEHPDNQADGFKERIASINGFKTDVSPKNKLKVFRGFISEEQEE